jgi:hypothetical protein
LPAHPSWTHRRPVAFGTALWFVAAAALPPLALSGCATLDSRRMSARRMVLPENVQPGLSLRRTHDDGTWARFERGLPFLLNTSKEPVVLVGVDEDAQTIHFLGPGDDAISMPYEAMRRLRAFTKTRKGIMHHLVKGGTYGSAPGAVVTALILGGAIASVTDGESAGVGVVFIGIPLTLLGGALGGVGGLLWGGLVAEDSGPSYIYRISPDEWRIVGSKSASVKVPPSSPSTPSTDPTATIGLIVNNASQRLTEPEKKGHAAATGPVRWSPLGGPCESVDQCANSRGRWPKLARCMPIGSERVCTQLCTTDCPDGFTCKPTTGAREQSLCVAVDGGDQETAKPVQNPEPKPLRQ